MTLLNGGVTGCDDHDAAPPILEATLSALPEAEAKRKVFILGDLFDFGLSARPRLRHLAKIAAESPSPAIFPGKEFGRVARGEAPRHGMAFENLRAYTSWTEVAAWLRDESGPGDLILMHCWQKHHIERAAIAQFGEVSCHLPDCTVVDRCEDCDRLGPVSASLVRIETVLSSR